MSAQSSDPQLSSPFWTVCACARPASADATRPTRTTTNSPFLMVVSFALVLERCPDALLMPGSCRRSLVGRVGHGRVRELHEILVVAVHVQVVFDGKRVRVAGDRGHPCDRAGGRTGQSDCGAAVDDRDVVD